VDSKLNATITRYWKRALTLCLTMLVGAFAPVPSFAHGGFDHVRGTVVRVAHNVLTVKTIKGDVEVKLDDKTQLTKNDQPAQVSNLTPGSRVIVDIRQGSTDKLAHSVKIGTAPKTTVQHARDPHK
jgi:S1-C subfamily serine protease